MGETGKLVDDAEVLQTQPLGAKQEQEEQGDIYAISILSSSPTASKAEPVAQEGSKTSVNGAEDARGVVEEASKPATLVKAAPSPLIDVDDSLEPHTSPDEPKVNGTSVTPPELAGSSSNSLPALQDGTSDPKTEGYERWEYLKRLHQPRTRASTSQPSLQPTVSSVSSSSQPKSTNHTPAFDYAKEGFPRSRQPPMLDTSTPPLIPSTSTLAPSLDRSSLPSRPTSALSTSSAQKENRSKSRDDTTPSAAPSRAGSSRSSPSRQISDPLASAYKQTIATQSTRLTVPDVLIYPHPADGFQTSLMQSWRSSGIHSNPTRKAQLEAFIGRLNIIINQTFDARFVTETINRKPPPQRYNVEPFGSVSWDGTTGFGDLDLVILDTKLPRGYEPKVWRQLPGMPAPPPLPEQAKGRKRNHFVQPNPKVPKVYSVDRLAACLRSAGMKNVMPIKWASVPIVKFVEPTYGWQCDINVNELGGWFNSQLILAYCNVNPHLVRPFIHTIKLWAANRCVNDPAGADGLITLSSYALTIMGIAYLQIRGCLPNLQACSAEEIEAIGGEQHNVVFVDWQNDLGTPIVCCFNRHPPADWRSKEPDLKAADAVRGFFEYFSTKGRVEHSLGRFDYANQALSILHGGLLSRVKIRRTPQAGVTAAEERLQVGDAGRGVQPRIWFDNRMIIQDPFIFMKSLARSINKNGFNAIIQEIDRAHINLCAGGHDEFWSLCEDAFVR